MKLLAYSAVVTTLLVSAVVQADNGEAYGPPVAKVMLRTGQTLVGEVVEETGATLTVRRIKTGDVTAVVKEDILKTEWSPPEKDIIATEGFCPYVAWRCAQKAGLPRWGKVLNVSSEGVVVSLGAKDGLRAGTVLEVYRLGDPILDPETTTTLGYERHKVWLLEVELVDDDHSVARPLRGAKVPPEGHPQDDMVYHLSMEGQSPPLIKVDDVVLVRGSSRAVALFPLRYDSQEAQLTAEVVAARLLASVVSRGVFVVERTRLREVMLELGLQQSELWDMATAARLGRQVGASALLLGGVSSAPSAFLVQLRLVDVATGQVLWAVSHEAARAPSGTAAMKGAAAPRSEVLPWQTSRLFGGKTFDGWLQSGGQWEIRDGWMVGRNQGDIRGLVTYQTLLANEFDLTLKVRCTGGYILVVLDDASRPGTGYHFALGYLYNKEIRVVSADGKTVYLREPFSCAPGRIYSLKVSMRPDRSEYYVDGTRVSVAKETTPLDAAWQLKLGTHPRRDTSVAFSAIQVAQPSP